MATLREATLQNGGDNPAAHASLAAAHANAGDVASARRMLGRVNRPAPTTAFAAITKAGKDGAALASATAAEIAVPYAHHDLDA